MSEPEADREHPSRLRAVVAVLAMGVAAVGLFVFLTRGDDYEVTATFENASQLVGGEQVVVGGLAAGKVQRIELGPSNEALVTFTVNEDFAPLNRGTTATIRSFSLSGIANRQVQLTLPADGEGGAQIPDGGTLGRSETVSEVDLDQIFNTLDPDTVDDFKHVIQGFERSYDGVGKQANRGYRYLNPFLSTSRQLFSELNLDQRALERLLVDTASLSGALAARGPDITGLVGNANRMMGALGRQKLALAESVSKLPDFMRRANTTFVNLRSALSDLDPLVDASKPVAVRLRPFLADLRVAARDAVPTIRDLDQIVRRQGPDNDLVNLTRLQRPLRARAIGSGAPDCGAGPENPADLQVVADDDFTQGAFGESTCSLRNSLGALSYFRAYTPDLVGWFDGFGNSGGVDANGTYARIAPVFNTFTFSTPGFPRVLEPPQTPAQQLAGLTTGFNRRCPGGNERDPGDGSTPFTDGGALTDGSQANGECDSSQVPVGP